LKIRCRRVSQQRKEARRNIAVLRVAGTLCSPPLRDFFDVETHPTIGFESTAIEHVAGGTYRVRGNLTMHGETHPVEVEATVHGVTRDPAGKDRVGAEVRGTISRAEFGLRWQQALETGGVMVADEVRVSADLSAVCTRESDG
jgi:polyisoprenoid-binding protein YceI